MKATGTQDYESIRDGPRQEVRSPEQVVLHFPVAGPTSRILAYGIDLFGVYLLEALVFFFVLVATPFADWVFKQFHAVAEQTKRAAAHGGNESPALLYLLAVFLLVQIVIEWGYFVFWEFSSGGRSIGKIALRLRVIRDGGSPITLREILLRNFLRVVDILPANYLIGLVAMVVSPEGKRLGDIAAGTVVVRMDRPAIAVPVLDEADAASGAFRFDRSHLALLGRAERALLRQTLRRVETLPPETAETALARAVDVLRVRIGYGPVEPGDRIHFLRAMLQATRRR
jgi:uncharacterized RDD family membrane protein YckC